MAKFTSRQPSAIFRAMFPDLPDWPESPRTALLALSSAQTFRVEELVQDDRYVIRAELPGLDPDNDIEVTLDGRVLTIHAERRQEATEPHRSEFHYGSLTRSVRLPARVDPQDVTASYRKGILEVAIPVREAKTEGSRIAIQYSDGPAPTQTNPGASAPKQAP